MPLVFLKARWKVYLYILNDEMHTPLIFANGKEKKSLIMNNLSNQVMVKKKKSIITKFIIAID